MNTFSEQIKHEISCNNYSKQQLLHIFYSYVFNNAEQTIYNKKLIWTISSQYNKTILFLSKIVHTFFNAKDVHTEFSNINKFNQRRTYRIVINNPNKYINSFLEFDEYIKEIKLKKMFKEFVIGAFLSAGSISSLEKSKYHLEITSQSHEYLLGLQSILLTKQICPVIIKRRTRWVLYIKKMLEISDFLKFIGANSSMLQLEDKILTRDYCTNLQRANNLDIANINKITKANIAQIKNIQLIVHKPIYKKQSDVFKFFCTIRLKYPLLSLSQLVDIFKNKYGITITKPGINYHVRLLNSIVSKTRK